jgi:hypothetical protein
MVEEKQTRAWWKKVSVQTQVGTIGEIYKMPKSTKG